MTVKPDNQNEKACFMGKDNYGYYLCWNFCVSID